jgi:hypothetical protein
MAADGTPLIVARGNLGSTKGSAVRIHVFNRVPEFHSADHVEVRLWERFWNGTTWVWNDTGRNVAGDPVAVSYGNLADLDGSDVRMNLFVTGDDGKLWERYWNGTTWTWADTGRAVPY